MDERWGRGEVPARRLRRTLGCAVPVQVRGRSVVSDRLVDLGCNDSGSSYGLYEYPTWSN